MKRVIALFVVLAVLGVFAFAGGSKEATTAPGKQAEVQSVTYRLAHSYPITHPFSKGSKELIKVVSEKTGGKFIINENPAGQLGSEKDLADGLVNGVIEMAIIGPGEIGKRYAPVLIFDGPFIFRNVEHAMNTLKSDVGKELWKGLEDKTGLINLTTLYYGTRYVTSKKPIKTPDDMKGMKLRAPDMPLSVANAKAMGANPTPMALSEVYLALQQNVVDGQENPIPTIYSSKFFEVQTHISLTGHVIQLTPVFIAKNKFNALPDSFKKALTEAIDVVAPQINKWVADDEKSQLDDMAKKGMTVTQPDIESFRKATQPVIKEFESKWGVGLYEKIQAVK
jgi:tripartite ATP-independent transporter DctP family solute receptor